MVSSILRSNRLDRGHYVEPFAGGAGLALALLYKGDVGEIHLNDIDPSISALWRSILGNAEALIDVMQTTPVTIEERERQRSIYLNQEGDDVAIGFATLFLNRVNRSGIIKTGGAIGGVQQNGPYTIDCRFNKADLIARIRRIAKYSKRIHFTSIDAREHLKSVVDFLPPRALVYADPPYFVKGAELYTSAFTSDDHRNLRDALLNLSVPWILTYDNVAQVRTLYSACSQYSFDIYYSAHIKRTGTELLVASKALQLPDDILESHVHRLQNLNLAYALSWGWASYADPMDSRNR